MGGKQDDQSNLKNRVVNAETLLGEPTLDDADGLASGETLMAEDTQLEELVTGERPTIELSQERMIELMDSGVASHTLDADPLRSGEYLLEASPELTGYAELEVDKEIGHGGMGSVLRGVDPELRRELAIKVIKGSAKAPPSRNQLLRFVEEAQVTAQLEHPNVVPVHGFGINDAGLAYFTMKLVRGESLETVLKRRREGDAETLERFGLRRLLDVYLDVCQAIEYAHSKGVIHRDLKPANIMVGEYGEVLVMDWGLAKVLRTDSQESHRLDIEALVEEEEGVAISTVRSESGAHQTLAGAVMGTPAYMSPEQAAGHNELVDERTDLYALGVLLYEILCDEVPFDSDSAVNLLRKVITMPPRPPSEVRPERKISPALEALALKLLEKEHARRTLTIPQIRSQIRDYIEGIETRYRPETVATKVIWGVGSILFFVFLVWYLSGQSVTGLLYPPVVLNAVGWFLVAVLLGFPLWAFVSAWQTSLGEADRFREPTAAEIFTSGFYRHRRWAAAVAPVFSLGFLVEIALWFTPILVDPKGRSAEVIHATADRLRGDVYHALIVPLVFLFVYLYLQMGEVRFARRVGRYAPLMRRSGWELLWPLFLIVALIVLVGSLDFVDWVVDRGDHDLVAFVEARIFDTSVDVSLIVKTVVFQGSFLLLVLVGTLLLVFPMPEVLAALRMRYRQGDEAFVRSHHDYFMRSLAIFEVMALSCLYGGALIGCLTAMTVLSENDASPLLERIFSIFGPSVVGFAGYFIWRWYVRSYVAQTPAVSAFLDKHVKAATAEQMRASYRACVESGWRERLLQFVAPGVCIVIYLIWEAGGDIQQPQNAEALIEPMATLGLYLALPFILLPLLILGRDKVYAAYLERRYPEVAKADD